MHADTLSVVSHSGVGDLGSGHPVPEVIVLYCVVQCSTVLYSVYCNPSRLVCLFLQTSIILYSTVLSVGICNMVQGVGRHAMSSIVLLEGTGAYGPLLVAPVEGLGGPLYLRETPKC